MYEPRRIIDEIINIFNKQIIKLSTLKITKGCVYLGQAQIITTFSNFLKIQTGMVNKFNHITSYKYI